MPDVKIYVTRELAVNHASDLWHRVPEIVAEQMSCTVDGKCHQHNPSTEIDLLITWVDTPPHTLRRADVQLSSESRVIIEVAAYDFDDRMANLPDRIKNIAVAVKELLGSGSDGYGGDVSITFIPVRQGCWAKV